MKLVTIKETRLIENELSAKLEALDDQKAKADSILNEELGVVRSVHALIMRLNKLNETRGLAEARMRIAALKQAILDRNNGVNMTVMKKEADELSSFGFDMIRDQERHKNMTQL